MLSKSFEMFLPELEDLKNARAKTCKKIKSHGLPVIIFGAGLMAKKYVVPELKNFGVEVDGFAVDAKYFQPNKTFLGKPIYNFDELSSQPDNYVFVLGISDEDIGGNRAVNFYKDEKIIRYILTCELAPIGYEYISARREKFAETFEMLSDELSRHTMIAYLKSKITGDPSYNFAVYDPNQYFNEVIKPAIGGGVCGLWCV